MLDCGGGECSSAFPRFARGEDVDDADDDDVEGLAFVRPGFSSIQ